MKPIYLIFVLCAICSVIARANDNSSVDRLPEEVMQLIKQHDEKEFTKFLSNLVPRQRAKAIVQWWRVNGAIYSPSGNVQSCYFFESMRSTGVDGLPVLKSAMSDGNDEVRVGASCVLQGESAKLAYTLFEELLKGLTDSDWRVREYCTMAISRFGYLSRRAIPLMIANLSHTSGTLRGWTVCCLGYLGEVSRPAVPYLVDMLRNPTIFDSGWDSRIAVDAIDWITFQKYKNTQEILEWWKEARNRKW